MQISREYIASLMVLPYVVCQLHQLEVMKWLHSVCNFTRKELDELFTMLCRKKQLNVEIALWFHEQCNFTNNEIEYNLRCLDNIADTIEAKIWMENLISNN